MTLAFRYAARTTVGLVRENNEDSGYAGPNLLMVADGMGGVEGGDIASALTIDAVRTLDHPGHPDPLAELRATIAEANARIARRGHADRTLEGMGTTLTAGLLYDDNGGLAIAHIGDSRLYLLRDGDLHLLTKDHTLVQSLVDDGRLTEQQARIHPHRALLVRVLDGREESQPDLDTVRLAAGDRLFFCSDGMEDVRDDDIGASMRDYPDPGTAAETLVRIGLRSGTTDNVTCLIGDVVEVPPGAGLPQTEVVVLGAADEIDLTERPVAAGSADTTATQPAVEAAGSGVPAGPAGPTGPGASAGGPGAVQSSAGAPVAAQVLDGPVDEEAESDEELRYAPRPPRRFRWLIRTVAVLVVLGVIGGLGFAGYRWTQGQYYVGAAGTGDTEHVTIYRGIAQGVPGLSLSSVYEVSDVTLQDLPSYQRSQVGATIAADSLAQARSIVADLRTVAEQCRRARTPQSQPTPSGHPSPIAQPVECARTRSGATTAPTTPPPTAKASTPAPHRTTPGTRRGSPSPSPSKGSR